MDEIEALLPKKERMEMLACNSCTRICKIDGREKAEEMTKQLGKRRYKVVEIKTILVGWNNFSAWMCSNGICSKKGFSRKKW